VIDRPKEPPNLDDEDDDEFGNAFPSERPTTPVTADPDGIPEERPTVSPPFDVEEFAKHSDSKMRAQKTPAPVGKPRDASTKPPPGTAPPEIDAFDELPGARVRPPQITLTDEDETEEARLRSVLMRTDPPPRRRSSPSNSPASRAQASERSEHEPHEDAPATQAYPAEYEKDPFAHLTAAQPRGSDAAAPTSDMKDRFSLGDYTGALEVAEAILAGDPVNDEALRCAEDSRAKLIQMYTARVGPLDRVPVVVVAREQLRWLSIDHRAGFLLSHIDGVSNLEMILDVSGMPLLDALKILAELQQQRVISFR
jgi:hypothetical protein